MGKRWNRKQIDYIEFLFPDKKYERLVNEAFSEKDINVANMNPSKVLSSFKRDYASLFYSMVLSKIVFTCSRNEYDEHSFKIMIANYDKINQYVKEFIEVLIDKEGHIKSYPYLYEKSVKNATAVVSNIYNFLVQKVSTIANKLFNQIILSRSTYFLNDKVVEYVFRDYFKRISAAMIDDYDICTIINEWFDEVFSLDMNDPSDIEKLQKSFKRLDGMQFPVSLTSRNPDIMRSGIVHM